MTTTHGEVADGYLAAARKLLTETQDTWLKGRSVGISVEALNTNLQTPFTIIGHLLTVAHVSAIRAQTEDGPRDA